MSTLVQSPYWQFADADGSPLAGASIFSYTPNTLTPSVTYQDPEGLFQNTNPIIADAAGRVVVFGSGSYRIIVKDRFGNQVFDGETGAVLSDDAISSVMAPVCAASTLQSARDAMGVTAAIQDAFSRVGLLQGAPGPQGATGPTGATGPQGPQGPPGNGAVSGLVMFPDVGSYINAEFYDYGGGSAFTGVNGQLLPGRNFDGNIRWGNQPGGGSGMENSDGIMPNGSPGVLYYAPTFTTSGDNTYPGVPAATYASRFNCFSPYSSNGFSGGPPSGFSGGVPGTWQCRGGYLWQRVS